MSKQKRERRRIRRSETIVVGLGLSPADDHSSSNPEPELQRPGLFPYLSSHITAIGIVAIVLLLGLGIMARNGWLPNTDLAGRKIGWFGKPLPKNASSSWNPLAAPLPTATPQLSKELIYAGSGGRLLAVEDANANAAPPADLAVWRTGTSGSWWVMSAEGGIADSAYWGTTGDVPVPGDFDGDGKTDFCVFRPSTGSWYQILTSTGSTTGFGFGTNGDLPQIGDFDGDGKHDPAVFRPSNSTWYWLKSGSSYDLGYLQFGTTNDAPALADYDGDGKADLTVWRLSDHTYYTRRSSDLTLQTASIAFSGYTLTSGDQVVSGDFDGDGKANYALRNGASWLMLSAAFANMTVVTPSGDASSDIPVPNDYDADGICDIAVWRPSNGDWYIRQSGSGGSLRQDHWGQNGDVPVATYWRR